MAWYSVQSYLHYFAVWRVLVLQQDETIGDSRCPGSFQDVHDAGLLAICVGEAAAITALLWHSLSFQGKIAFTLVLGHCAFP